MKMLPIPNTKRSFHVYTCHIAFRISSSRPWMATTFAYLHTDRPGQERRSPSLVAGTGRVLVLLLGHSTASLTCLKKTSKFNQQLICSCVLFLKTTMYGYLMIMNILFNIKKCSKDTFLYSAVSSSQDCSMRFTLHPLATLFISTSTRLL